MSVFQLLVLIGLIGVAALGCALALYFRRRFGDVGFMKKEFLSGNEVDFFHRLRKAVGSSAVICPQVAMGALVDSTFSRAHPRYWEHRQSFHSRICDFVLCDPKTLKPLLIVELDDAMHDFEKDRTRDAVTGSAGYHTVRFWSRSKPDCTTLKATLQRHCSVNGIPLRF